MLVLFFFNDTAPTEIYTLSLHDALPICFFHADPHPGNVLLTDDNRIGLIDLGMVRSEEHTSELQSRGHLVCRLLLEKKNYPAHRTRCRRASPRPDPSRTDTATHTTLIRD